MQYPAHYYDGRTAARKDVLIEVSRKRLEVAELNGEQINAWPLKRIKRSHPILRDGPLRLRKGNYSNARLVIQDLEAVAELSDKLPCLFERQHTIARFLRAALTLALVTIFVVSAIYFAIPRLAKPIASAVSIEVETRIGEAARESITGEWPACAGPGVEGIAMLVSRLEKTLDAPYAMQVTVAKTELKNAFALPGGHIVVTSSLISFMDNPDELAGVLAHEMGHVVLRHPLENMLSQLGVILVMNVVAGGSSSDIAGLGALFATTSYTRDYERLADDFALTLLEEANINPLKYADLFERFSEAESNASSGFLGLSDLLRTHPTSLDRAALAAQAGSAQSTPSLDQAAWNSIVALCPEEDDEDGPNGRVDRTRRNTNSPAETPNR